MCVDSCVSTGFQQHYVSILIIFPTEGNTTLNNYFKLYDGKDMYLELYLYWKNKHWNSIWKAEVRHEQIWRMRAREAGASRIYL